MVAQKDYNLEKHPDIDTANLFVIKAAQSLSSRGYVKTRFSWQYFYYTLTPEVQLPPHGQTHPGSLRVPGMNSGLDGFGHPGMQEGLAGLQRKVASSWTDRLNNRVSTTCASGFTSPPRSSRRRTSSSSGPTFLPGA